MEEWLITDITENEAQECEDLNRVELCHPGLKSHENAAKCIVDFLLLTPAYF